MIKSFSKKMCSLLLGTIATTVFLVISGTSSAQVAGEKEFNTICIACHTVGEGPRVGPDLAGVTDRRSEDWLVKFIKSSQSMIDSGDPDAVALAEQFAGLVMPDTAMSDQQIKDIVGFLKIKGSSAPVGTGKSMAAPDQATAIEPASEEDILLGQNYFQGEERFENGGAACNACHDVRNDAVIGGGILAAELTTVFSRMGGAGVKAILGHAPFPVMQAAYKDRPLTEHEVSTLVAFLEYADSEEYNQLPRDYGIGLFFSGTVGAGVLFFLFGFLWRERKDGSVNQAIYDRQIKSESDRDSG